MRILLVNDYANPTTGGAEVVLLMLRDELRRRGHEVRVFASRVGLNGNESFADYTCFGTGSRWQTMTSVFNPSCSRELRRAIREFQPDLIHVKMFLWQLSPSILSCVEGVPSIAHVVTYKPVCPRGTKMLPDRRRCTFKAGRACLRQGCLTPQSWVLLMVQRWRCRRGLPVFNAIVANSDACRRRLDEDDVVTVGAIPNGTPVVPGRPPLGDPPVLAYAGRLSPEKGVDVLLRAFAQARDSAPGATLTIAGDGPEAAALRELSSTLGLDGRVEFTGVLSGAELERRLSPAWAQVVPSCWDEPFGMVAIEAMMRGTAVIASNAGGLAEIVLPHVTGLLVPPGDSAVLAGAMRTLLLDRQLCERLGLAGRDLALSRYTCGHHVDRIEELYRRVLQERYQ